MRIRNRSFIIMLSKALAQASTIALAICLVRLIDQNVFGTYRQVLLVFTTVSALLSLQLEDSLFYFVPKMPAERLRPLVYQTLLLGFTSSAISGAIIFFGAGAIARSFNNPALVWPLRVIAIYPLTEKITVLVPAFMLSTDKAVRAASYSLASSVGRVLAVLIAFAMGGSLVTVIWSMVGVSLATMLVAVGDMIRSTPRRAFQFDRALAYEQFTYCVPLFLTALTGVINREYDKWLISSYFNNPAVYAIYSCGAMELPIIGIITSSVTAAILPNLVRNFQDGRAKEAILIWQEAARKCSLVIIPTFAFMIAVPVEFMTLLYGESYSLAALPFAVYLLALPLRVALYAVLLRASGRTKPIAVVVSSCMVLNMVLSTVLVLAGRGTMLSFIGPCAATVFTTFVIAGSLLREVCRSTGLRAADIMRWDELLRIGLYALFAAVVMMLVPLPDLRHLSTETAAGATLGIRAVVFVVVLGLTLWISRFLSPDERQLVLSPLNWLRRRRMGRETPK